MPLITEISNDSCGSMEVSREASVDVARNSEKLEIHSDGINLCFIEKHEIETEDEGFISSYGGMQILDKLTSFHHHLNVPTIQEMDSQDVADSRKDFLVCSTDHTSVETDLSYSVNADMCGMYKEEACNSSFICKFL